MQLIKQIGYFSASLIVKIAGWFIGQQNFWPANQGARQDNPLLFAPGKLSGAVGGAVR